MEKWAIETLSALPPIPVPFLLAFIVCLLLIIPLIRKALRTTPLPQSDFNPQVMLNAGGIYTMLVNIQIEIERLSREVRMIDRMLRRRSGRSKKLKTPNPDD